MNNSSVSTPPNRCRLVLVTTGEIVRTWSDSGAQIITSALSAGDVASIIFSQDKLDETEFLTLVRPLVEAAQSCGVAAIVAGDSRVAGRVGADGIQLGQDPDLLRDAVERFTPKQMVGVGNVRTRHNALVLGEIEPDYMMFGKTDGDTHDEPHPKNLNLGEWWASMVEIPGIVMGGRQIESVIGVAQTGVDFVALGTAIFAPDSNANNAQSAATRVKQANQVLDEHAPEFEDEE